MTPAVHVSEKLRKFAERDIFRVNGIHVPEAGILHRGIHGKNRHSEGSGNQTAYDERRDDYYLTQRRPQPFSRACLQLRLDPHGAGAKEHWIDWREIINLAMHCDHFHEDDDIGPRQRGINSLRGSLSKPENVGARDAIGSLIL